MQSELRNQSRSRSPPPLRVRFLSGGEVRVPRVPQQTASSLRDKILAKHGGCDEFDATLIGKAGALSDSDELPSDEKSVNVVLKRLPLYSAPCRVVITNPSSTGGIQTHTFLMRSGGVLRIGRAPGNDIVYECVHGVSNFHAELCLRHMRENTAGCGMHRLYIRDNVSTNYTSVRRGPSSEWSILQQGEERVVHDGWQLLMPGRRSRRLGVLVPEDMRTFTIKVYGDEIVE